MLFLKITNQREEPFPSLPTSFAQPHTLTTLFHNSSDMSAKPHRGRRARGGMFAVDVQCWGPVCGRLRHVEQQIVPLLRLYKVLMEKFAPMARGRALQPPQRRTQLAHQTQSDVGLHEPSAICSQSSGPLAPTPTAPKLRT
jgi:hypothetical protein